VTSEDELDEILCHFLTCFKGLDVHVGYPGAPAFEIETNRLDLMRFLIIGL